MKNVFKSSLLVILLFVGITLNAQDKPVTFGVKAGMNLSNFSGNGADGSDAKIGFNVGLTLDYAINQDLYLMTGLEFTMKGAKDEGSFNYEHVSFSGKVKANPMYLQIPIHLGYKLTIADNTSLVFHAGPYIAYGVGGKYKLETSGTLVGDINTDTDFFGDDMYNRFDFGLGLGVGLEFGKIGVGLGYDFGLVNISGESDAKVRNMNAYLTLGYKF